MRTWEAGLCGNLLSECQRHRGAASPAKCIGHCGTPGLNAKEQMDRIHDLLQLGVDGFEVFSSYHSEQQTQFYYDLAKSHGLYMTYGSDFHGKTKPAVHIGMCSMEEKENTCLVRKLETLRI